MIKPLEILAELVQAAGPPGEERLVASVLTRFLDEAAIPWRIDERGNLLASSGTTLPNAPRIVVTAHMDEIALMVQRILPSGSLAVVPLGGVHPWKWGEAPVDILCSDNTMQGILSFGSIHTSDPASVIQRARDGKVPAWSDAHVVTGIPKHELPDTLRPGTRVVLSADRRKLVRLGKQAEYIAGPFLDDRAACVAWLQLILDLKQRKIGTDILFAATTSEEIGGHGAIWLLGGRRPEICIALEIAPITTDNDVELSAIPTCWSADGYAPSSPADLQLVANAADVVGTGVTFHVLTRGGSDASCAAVIGHCARNITLALPVENTHGFEVMHIDAIPALVRLTLEVLTKL